MDENVKVIQFDVFINAVLSELALSKMEFIDKFYALLRIGQKQSFGDNQTYENFAKVCAKMLPNKSTRWITQAFHDLVEASKSSERYPLSFAMSFLVPWILDEFSTKSSNYISIKEYFNPTAEPLKSFVVTIRNEKGAELT